VDFTHAVVVGDRAEYLFREDLRDLGLLISQALDDVPMALTIPPTQQNVPELADLIVQMVDTETDGEERGGWVPGIVPHTGGVEVLEQVEFSTALDALDHDFCGTRGVSCIHRPEEQLPQLASKFYPMIDGPT
ncbi:3482_t:CDS:2, partial [Acaulospora colombiana]